MAALRQWQDHVRLGQLIIRELGNESRNGVLGRWMAQRVAELLRRAENSADPAAKEAAERECQDLIIRLWESRESWPAGGPLGSVLPTLKALLAGEPDYRRWRSQPSENQSIGWITRLLQLQRQELRYFCLALRNYISAPMREELRQLLTEYSADLSKEEVNVLYFLTATPSLFFDSEAEAELGEQEPPEEPELAPSNKLAAFLALTTKERQQFFAQLASSLTSANTRE